MNKVCIKREDEICVTLPWTFEMSEHLHEKRKSKYTSQNEASVYLLDGQNNIKQSK